MGRPGDLPQGFGAPAGDYNVQSPWAHRERPDGRSSSREVLGWATGVRYRAEDLERAFFSTRFSCVLDPFGYARLMRWRIYGEEGLARREAALWLHAGTLTVEHAGETLPCHEVELAPGTRKLRTITRSRVYETLHVLPQLRLFALEALGEAGWLKVLRLRDYASRKPRRSLALQEALFPYLEAF